MKSFAFLVAICFLLFAPIANAGKAKTQNILSTTTVATGTPELVTVQHALNSSAYLVVKTESEVNTASLAVTVSLVNALGNNTLCTATAITTETTTLILIGSLAAAASGVTDACDFSLSRETLFTFTVTGAAASFDITADLEWIAD